MSFNSFLHSFHLIHFFTLVNAELMSSDRLSIRGLPAMIYSLFLLSRFIWFDCSVELSTRFTEGCRVHKNILHKQLYEMMNTYKELNSFFGELITIRGIFHCKHHTLDENIGNTSVFVKEGGFENLLPEFAFQTQV